MSSIQEVPQNKLVKSQVFQNQLGVFELLVFSYVAVFVFLLGIFLRVKTLFAARKYPPKTLPVASWDAGWKRVLGLVGRGLGVRFLLLRPGIWVLALGLHLGFFVLVLKHLKYFLGSPSYVLLAVELWGTPAALALGLACLGLLVLRFLPVLRFVSSFEDYFVLLLLMASVGTGLGLKYWWPVNFVQVRDFVLGALNGCPVAFPEHLLFQIHYSLALLLLMIVPFSKLVHAFAFLVPKSRRYIV